MASILRISRSEIRPTTGSMHLLHAPHSAFVRKLRAVRANVVEVVADQHADGRYLVIVGIILYDQYGRHRGSQRSLPFRLIMVRFTDSPISVIPIA